MKWFSSSFIQFSAFCTTVITTLLHLTIVVRGDIQGRIVQMLAGSFCTGHVEVTPSLLLKVREADLQGPVFLVILPIARWKKWNHTFPNGISMCFFWLLFFVLLFLFMLTFIWRVLQSFWLAPFPSFKCINTPIWAKSKMLQLLSR